MIKSKMEFNKDEKVPMLGTLCHKFSFLVVPYVAFLFVIQFSLIFFGLIVRLCEINLKVVLMIMIE